MNILITGGAGFIGAHTAVALLTAGHDVVIADNFRNSDESVIKNIEKITGRKVKAYQADLTDEKSLAEIFSENAIHAVVHFAGLKAVGESVKNPLAYYYNNIGGTLNLLHAMEAAGCRTLAFSSSATVYGGSGRAPFAEDAPLSVTSPYGRTKLMAEEILRDLCAADREWRVILLRYFNPVGAHESGLIGEDPKDTPGNLFPYIAQVAAGLRPELYVFGNDYETEDGTGVRDYIHVMDVAEGHAAALEYIKNAPGVEAVNLGTGQGTSVLALIAAFEKASGRKIPYKIVSRRPGDVAVSFADTKKARELFSFAAKRDIGKMCLDGWNYYRKKAGV